MMNESNPQWNPLSKKSMWKWGLVIAWMVLASIWGTISILASIIEKLGALI